MTRSVKKNKRFTTTSLVVLYVVSVLFTTSVAIAASSNGSFADTLRLFTSKKPETFTELYFINPGQLPSYATAGTKQTIYFHIQSHLTEKQTYTYRITFTTPQGTTVSTSNVSIAPWTGVTIPFTFSIAAPNEMANITVSLVGADQQISLKVKS